MQRRLRISLDGCHPSRQTLTIVTDVTVETVAPVGYFAPHNQISSHAPVHGNLLAQALLGRSSGTDGN
jgi:hypothetical protein